MISKNKIEKNVPLI